MAIYVTTCDVSIVDLIFRIARPTSHDEVCPAMKNAPVSIVSTDFAADAYPSVSNAAGMELNSNFFKVVGWYDNEWGYTKLCDRPDFSYGS